MAARKATAAAEPTQLPIDTRWVPIFDVTPNPANIRHDLGDLSELAASVAEHGVLQPLVVHADVIEDGAPTFVVIMGHRRLAAATIAKVAEVPVLVRPKPDPGELAELMLAENLQRENLDPIDEALALVEVKKGGRKTLAQIAARVNRSSSWVAGRLAIVSKLPEDLWDDVRTGALPVNDAVALAQAPISDAERKRLAKSSSAARTWELGQAIAGAKVNKALADATKAFPTAQVSKTHPEAYNADVTAGPLGAARYGQAVGQINTPPELCGHDHLYVQVTHTGDTVAWNLHPELLPAELFVAPEPTDDDEKLTPWTEIDWTVARPAVSFEEEASAADVRRWDLVRIHEANCDDHRLVSAPWRHGRPLEVCVNPEAPHDWAAWATTTPKANHRNQVMPFDGPEGDRLEAHLAELLATIPEDLLRALVWIDPWHTFTEARGDDRDFAVIAAESLRGQLNEPADAIVDDHRVQDYEVEVVRWAMATMTEIGANPPASVVAALEALDSASDAEPEGDEADDSDGPDEATTAGEE